MGLIDIKDPISTISDLVKTGLNKFVRDKMSEKDAAELEQNMEMFLLKEAREENSAFREFVVQYEGAAKDYINVPIVGPLILVLRGMIRPVFTWAVGYWDYLYFTGTTSDWADEKIALLKAINIIVLMFWFGERAIKNTGLMDLLLKKVQK